MAAPLLTLDQLITEACELYSDNDAPTRYHDSALKHAKAWRRKLITSTGRENKVVPMELGNDRTVQLPDDYVEYNALSILSTDRQTLYPLVYGDVPPGASLAPINTAAYPFDWMREGGFHIDLAKRRIVCNSLVPELTILVLDYKSFSATSGEDIAIDPLAHSWGVQYILAALYKQKQQWAAYQVAAADRDQEYELYKQQIRNLSLAGIRQVNRDTAAQLWK